MYLKFQFPWKINPELPSMWFIKVFSLLPFIHKKIFWLIFFRFFLLYFIACVYKIQQVIPVYLKNLIKLFPLCQYIDISPYVLHISNALHHAITELSPEIYYFSCNKRKHSNMRLMEERKEFRKSSNKLLVRLTEIIFSWNRIKPAYKRFLGVPMCSFPGKPYVYILTYSDQT